MAFSLPLSLAILKSFMGNTYIHALNETLIEVEQL